MPGFINWGNLARLVGIKQASNVFKNYNLSEHMNKTYSTLDKEFEQQTLKLLTSEDRRNWKIKKLTEKKLMELNRR